MAKKPAQNGSGVTVGEGPHGRGVFAARAFASGEVVESCPTVELADADVTGRLNDYVGLGMLFNHSADPNLEYVQDDPTTIVFRTVRKVKRGDELTIDYGDEWWETRGLEPG